jgi:hypothetical protein
MMPGPDLLTNLVMVSQETDFETVLKVQEQEPQISIAADRRRKSCFHFAVSATMVRA